MNTLYYRKIAEMVLRDGDDPKIYNAAMRVVRLGHGPKDRPRRRDRKRLRAWMLAWIDEKTTRPALDR